MLVFFTVSRMANFLWSITTPCVLNITTRRDILAEYSKQLMKLGNFLLELLSEALGLNPNHLNDIDCSEGLQVLGHYYPACPQPELTLGTTKHADNSFLTVLLQDHIGGLQVLYQDKRIDIPPVPGALVVNIGDFLQVSFHTIFLCWNIHVNVIWFVDWY